MAKQHLYKVLNNNKINIDKLNPITKYILKKGFVEENDIDLINYDIFINYILEEYEYYEIIIAVNYVIDRMSKNNMQDENGNKIINRIEYFKVALRSNLFKNNNLDDSLYNY